MRRNRAIIIAVLLTLIDQLVKLFIKLFHINTEFNIIGDYIRFRPHLNTDYSWINSLGNFGIGLGIHIALVLIIIGVSVVIYGFITTRCKDDKLIEFSFGCLFGGAISSLIDKIFWDGSLDFISLEQLFIFDLKDVYISTFQFLIIYMLLVNYRGFADLKEKQIINEFRDYITSVIIRT